MVHGRLNKVILALIVIGILLIAALIYLISVDRKLTRVMAKQHGIEVWMKSHSDSVYKVKEGGSDVE